MALKSSGRSIIVLWAVAEVILIRADLTARVGQRSHQILIANQYQRRTLDGGLVRLGGGLNQGLALGRFERWIIRQQHFAEQPRQRRATRKTPWPGQGPGR
jgi:hypothetical protein